MTREWRTYAGVVFPEGPAGELTDEVTRDDAEPVLLAAATAWMGDNFDDPWRWDTYQVLEDLTDADGTVLRWAAIFEAVGEHPTTAPAWWWDWTPEDGR